MTKTNQLYIAFYEQGLSIVRKRKLEGIRALKYALTMTAISIAKIMYKAITRLVSPARVSAFQIQ